MTTNATDVLQFSTVLNHEKPISLINAKSASRFLREAEHNGDRAPTGRRTLTAIQNETVLRQGLEGMKFLVMMWLGYMIGLQRAG